MPETAPRAIRVFVSSTFRDMAAEREELVKFVFPQLRKLCEERGVTWGEVDLRWGITDEEAAEGKVLPICLAEIERSRPYFIGLLGERYGWVPRDVPQDLIEGQPWLAQHRECSVTELEILHGVLNNPEMAEHAFFYLRDSSYVERLADDVRVSFRDTGENVRRLAALKQRIRESGFTVHEDYPDPKTLGELVFRDLREVIERRFPESSVPDPMDTEAAGHEAFAASRTGVYVGRRDYFEALDAHAVAHGPPLVLTGESGSGKSALLANWAVRWRASHADDIVVMHFIGATSRSAGWEALLRRIMRELQRAFELRGEIPDQTVALRATFPVWLRKVPAERRVVLVLDALNQLEDRDGALDLVWLPHRVPPNVRVVLSSLPGRPADELAKRGWTSLAVRPLDVDERLQIVVEYLHQYTKSLSPERTGRIAAAPQAASPLFLCAMLDELRQWGDHQTLDECIAHYLAAATVGDLYQLILERYENDYEDECPGLVGDAMSAIWAARRGLSEAELLDLLGREGEPLPSAHWSPLSLAAEQSLIRRSGLIGFSHPYLRQAVKERYLPADRDRAGAHVRLADYFDVGRRPSASPRCLDELPWQLGQASALQRLSDLLAELPFFGQVWDADQFGARACWAQIERDSSLRLVDAYRKVLEEPARHEPRYLWRIARLLELTGHVSEALPLRQSLVEHFRGTGELAELQASLGNLAVNLRVRGELDQALGLQVEKERICRALGDLAGLQASLGNQAVIFRAQGMFDRAMALHREEEQICRQLGDLAGRSCSLGNQAVILRDQGKLDQAMTLLKKQERICREVGDAEGLQRCLGGQAAILSDQGELDAAMALHAEEERICRELGYLHGLQVSLGNRGMILYSQGKLDQALVLLREQEGICRGIPNPEGLHVSLGNQAVVLQAQGMLDQAMTLLEEQERISRDLGDPRGLHASLGNQGAIHCARGELDVAMALFKEKEQICRELGDLAGLQASLGNQGTIHCARGELDQAMALQIEQERICRELGNPEGIAFALCNQGILLANAGRRDRALELVDDAYAIALSSGLGQVARQIELARAQLKGDS